MINIKDIQDDLRGGFIYKYDFVDLLKMVEHKSRNSTSKKSQV